MAQKITREFLRDLKVEKDIDIPDSELRGFYVRARASGKRYFYVIRRHGNRILKIRLGDCALMTLTEAREKAKQHLAKIELGDLPTAAPKATSERTLDDFLKGSYGDRLDTETKRPEDTKKRIRQAFQTLLDTRLDRIDTAMVDRWRAARIKSGVKPASVNRNTNDLKAMLNFALLRGLISAHPMQTVKNLREESESRIRYLTPPEETRLRTALDARETMKRESRERGNQWRIERSHDPRADLRVVAFVDYLKPAVLLSLNTGLRQGEVFKLTWPSVNLEKGMVTVTASSAKSQKSRHVPLNAEAKAVLKAWQEQGSGEGYVFPSRDGGPLSEIKTAWLKLLRDADIKNFRWHDMRHHFASRLVMAGVDLNTVRELLGHSDIKMTLRYAHLAPEHKRAAVELISGSSNVTPVKKRRSKSTTKPPERE
jgi:integrase